MRKIMNVAIVLAVCLGAAAAVAEEPAYKETAGKLKAAMDGLKEPLNNWKYRSKCDERCLRPDIPAKLSWKSAAPGFYWPEPNQVFWFRREYTVPEKVAGRSVEGSKITFSMNVSDGGEVYVNGRPAGDAKGVEITGDAKPGEEIVIGVRVFNKTYAGAFLGSELQFSVFDDIKKKTGEYIDRVEEAGYLIPYSEEKDRWTGVLNSSAEKIDVAALEDFDEEKYFASLDAAMEELKKLAPLYGPYTLYMISYSHIDLAWLWDYDEGEIVTRDTLKTIFKFMQEYPDWIYAHSQAHSVKWMEDDYPEIFAELRDWVKKGRIELVGGTWSEHDSNIPSGEGFVRQFLYGKRYFRDKFGKDIVVAWTPDSFGYNWNLPQILKKSGMIGFLTQKLGMNEFTRFPYKVFWWEGADGTRMLTYFPPSGYGSSGDRKGLVAQMAAIKNTHGIDENFAIFGVGDHGGGVTRGHMERVFALKDSGAAPKVVFTTAEDYFTHLNELSKTHDFPVWHDELYLEHHRGTYTTQSETKKNNRRCEQLLMDAEKLAVIAERDYGVAYPADAIFQPGWYYVMLNHMHDILPGSGIRKVYEDADRDYAKVRETANGIIGGSLDAIAADVDTEGEGEPLLVFNTLSWERDAIVEQAVDGLTDEVQVLAPDGSEVLCQLTQKDGQPHVLFVARGLPAMGYRVYRVFPAGGASPAGAAPGSDLSTGDGTIENSLVKIAYDKKTGELTSLYDMKLGREFLSDGQPGNVLQAYEDTQNAWEIMTDQPIYFDKAKDAEIVESGPVRTTLKSTRRLNISDFSFYVSMYEHDPLVHFRIDTDWQERHTTLKLAFTLDLLNEDAWFEIPYAAISRKAIPDTLAEKAKFEVSAHKWVDYTDGDGSAGVSMLNNSKYGYDVRDNVLRMSVLRSPTTPDPLADRGEHVIEYALYTHPGGWREAGTSRRGYEYNYTPHVLLPGKHAGNLPAEHSFFSAGPDNVALTVVKKAEDGDGIIMRFVETEGGEADAVISLPWEPARVVETNLIEDEIEETSPVEVEGSTVRTRLGKYEIRTLKLVF